MSDKVLTQSTTMAPLRPVPLPRRCWEKLGIDIVGLIEGAPLIDRFAITADDYRSKWAELGLVGKITS